MKCDKCNTRFEEVKEEQVAKWKATDTVRVTLHKGDEFSCRGRNAVTVDKAGAIEQIDIENLCFKLGGGNLQEVKPERWRAEDGGKFYLISYGGVILSANGKVAGDIYDYGNYFQTKAQAEVARDKIKALLMEIHNQE